VKAHAAHTTADEKKITNINAYLVTGGGPGFLEPRNFLPTGWSPTACDVLMRRQFFSGDIGHIAHLIGNPAVRRLTPAARC